MTTNSLGGVGSWFHRQAAEYRHGEERPLGGYVVLMGIYAGGTAAAAGTAKALGRPVPADLSAWEVARLALATHKVARLLAKDAVTSPLRAPFTRFQGTSGPSELAEDVRGHGLQHAVGELLVCPMCLGLWVATGFTLGLSIAPLATRLIIGTFAGLTGADFLQHLYVRLQQATE